MLKRIFLVRHAQSEEDIDPCLHSVVPDRRISITTTGKKQALEIVGNLSQEINLYQRVKVITSPSNRADQSS